MEELLDIYDESWNHIGTASRRDVHEKGLLHQVVHCWVIAETEPVIYFQQRAHTKKDFPGYYDLACGGHIDAGETPQTAVLREIQEETGLRLTQRQLIPLGKYRAPDFKIPGYYDRETSNVFVLRQDHPDFSPGEEVGRIVRILASEFYHMEVDGAEKIRAETENGEQFTIHRNEWCCHDGEFQAKVLPYLRTAFPEFAAGGD
ncbi:MAG: NUDIX domain-containing protein [Clostridia bacterium]|nr:NUDIX domain-containing protein [Clostridia bacterium]